MRRGFVIALLVGFVLSTAPGRADDESRLKIAREIVVVTHSADTVRSLMPTFMAQVRTMLVQQNPSATKLIDILLQRSSQRFDQQLDSFVGLAAEVFAREFSESDLEALLAFDRSPAGQHLIGKQVEINQAMAKVGQKWGQMIAQKVIDDFKKENAAAPPPKL